MTGRVRGLLSLLSGMALILVASAANAAVVLFDNFDFSQRLISSIGLVMGPLPPTRLATPPSILSGLVASLIFRQGMELCRSGWVFRQRKFSSGTARLVATFSAGNYTLSFFLGGNERGAPAQATEVQLGSFTTGPILLSSGNRGDPLAFYTFSFSTNGGTLSFIEDGPSDQQGNLLDVVTLSSVSPCLSQQPDRSARFGLGLMRRRKRITGTITRRP